MVLGILKCLESWKAKTMNIWHERKPIDMQCFPLRIPDWKKRRNDRLKQKLQAYSCLRTRLAKLRKTEQKCTCIQIALDLGPIAKWPFKLPVDLPDGYLWPEFEVLMVTPSPVTWPNFGCTQLIHIYNCLQNPSVMWLHLMMVSSNPRIFPVLSETVTTEC